MQDAIPHLAQHHLWDSDFLWKTGLGMPGLLAWILTAWATPGDDTVTGTFRNAFGAHGRQLLIALIFYLAACFGAHEAGELTVLAAFTTGYTIQSITERGFTSIKVKTGNTGGPWVGGTKS